VSAERADEYRVSEVSNHERFIYEAGEFVSMRALGHTEWL